MQCSTIFNYLLASVNNHDPDSKRSSKLIIAAIITRNLTCRVMSWLEPGSITLCCVDVDDPPELRVAFKDTTTVTGEGASTLTPTL